ncbi:type II toxin-antitoxin system HicB family antitoxin [Pelagibacterium limicola]|uniref:type II toxin-antitoxin system HicB family antitoxin n=1 Tax=Pelagibacterium limicola TaxID=2791022 RepID=UPI0018AFE44C|nr:type II toxin-antitoxin system HicB family antitoxin [Pelagibacterium limicola]
MYGPYPLSFTAEDGDIVVRSRDFPELLTAGGTEAEALELAEDALVVVVLGRRGDGSPLPKPSRPEAGEQLVYLPAAVAAKLAVLDAFEAAGISKAELGRRLGVAVNEVQRILDVDHKTKLNRLEAAARALGVRLIVSAEAA